jgi:tetratricopeptide (TPR) repeat protein
LALNPGYDLSWNNLGNVLEESGELAEAQRAYEMAVELVPDHATYRVNLASALARGSDVGRAVEHLARAVALAPEIRSLLPGFTEFAGILGDPRLLTQD